MTIIVINTGSSTSPWSLWFDAVLPECPGVPQTYATNCIRDAAIEYFEKTRAWQETSDVINAVANQAEYAFAKASLLNTFKVKKWKQVFWKGGEIYETNRERLEVAYRNWTTQAGTPNEYLALHSDKLTLVPYPTANATAAIVMVAILTPNKASTGIEAFLLDDHYEAIGFGAKARIQRTPKTPYFDAAASEVNRAIFESKIGDARHDATLGKTNSAIVPKTRYF